MSSLILPEKIDPKQTILDALAGIKLPRPLLAQVLVAVYVPPVFRILADGTKFYNTPTSQKEAEFTGFVGLVLAKGPDCFRYDLPEPDEETATATDMLAYRAAMKEEQEQNFHVGDWIMLPIYETQSTKFKMGGMLLAMVKDNMNLAVVDDPEMIK